MKRVAFGALIIAAATLGTASAIAAGPASSDPHVVQAGSYKVEPNHTQVLFTVSHIGLSEYSGRFSGVTGSLTLDPKHVGASALDVSVPVSSVSTTSTKLDDELRGPEWLDAGKFADIRYHATKITPTGEGRARIDGELTLHGVTRPVVLQARFVGAGVNPIDKAYTVGFEATGTLERSAFGVKTYLPLIGDRIEITIHGAFEKAS